MSTAASVKMQKLGVRFRPPTIFLFYTDLKTGKLRRRTVILNDFTASTDINDYAKELHNNRVTRNRNLFRFVPLRRLERLLFVLKEGQAGSLTKVEIEKKLKKFDNVDSDEDLNKLDDEELKHKKLIMTETYEKNLVDQNSKEFIYDVVVDFEPPSERNPASEWDSEDELEDLKKKVQQQNDDDQNEDNEDDEDDDDDDDDDFK